MRGGCGGWGAGETYDTAIGDPHAGLEWQTAVLDAPRLVLGMRDVGKRDRRVVRHVRNPIAAGREARAMHPTLRVKLHQHLAYFPKKRQISRLAARARDNHQLLTKCGDLFGLESENWLTRAFVDTFHSSREDARLKVGRTGQQQEIVGMPKQEEANSEVFCLKSLSFYVFSLYLSHFSHFHHHHHHDISSHNHHHHHHHRHTHQSTKRTVDLCFLMCFETHQSLSSSK
jgi:hypothetical protein